MERELGRGKTPSRNDIVLRHYFTTFDFGRKGAARQGIGRVVVEVDELRHKNFSGFGRCNMKFK